MTNLDSVLKSRDITLPTKVRLVKAMVFPVVMYGCHVWVVFLLWLFLSILFGLGLIDRVPEELCTEIRNIVPKTVIKKMPKKNKCKKGNMVVCGGFTNS